MEQRTDLEHAVDAFLDDVKKRYKMNGGDKFTCQFMRRLDHLRGAKRRPALKPRTAAMPMIRETPRGHGLYRSINEAGGHTYWSDEIGGGVMVWDTCLVSSDTLIAALDAEGVEIDEPGKE